MRTHTCVFPTPGYLSSTRPGALRSNKSFIAGRDMPTRLAPSHSTALRYSLIHTPVRHSLSPRRYAKYDNRVGPHVRIGSKWVQGPLGNYSNAKGSPRSGGRGHIGKFPILWLRPGWAMASVYSVNVVYSVVSPA